jgi:SAM-dependent MidA family methyltransferase
VSLRKIIAEEIRARGPIPFSRYMELCLYHPDLGYYSRAEEKFGKAGDFYTSSDVHAVFGRLLCRQFDEMWRALGTPERIDVIELGPGRGLFAQDVLAWAEKKFPAFFAAVRYRLVESSPRLRARLEDRLRERIAAGKAEVVAEVGGASENAIVFANEFFDALPVEVVANEGCVLVDVEEQTTNDPKEHKSRFVERFDPASAELLEWLDRYGVQPEAGERVEAVPAYRAYVEGIAHAVKRGFVVAIDYGYVREEMLAGRHRGTVTAFRRHTMSDSPYEAPGEQDITAHVNFTALAAMAQDCGMAAHPLVTQSQFLLGIGEANQFADAFEDCRLPQEQATVALQLKHLVTPAGMGETFHVQVWSRGVKAKLSGLNWGSSG